MCVWLWDSGDKLWPRIETRPLRFNEENVFVYVVAHSDVSLPGLCGKRGEREGTKSQAADWFSTFLFLSAVRAQT